MLYYLFSYPFTPNYTVHGKTVNIFNIPPKDTQTHLLSFTDNPVCYIPRRLWQITMTTGLHRSKVLEHDYMA